MSVHLFGIRHHGPGSSRSLVRALQELEPDIVLLEGPPDGQEMISYVMHEAIKPPVALLIYAADAPKRASYYPFAEFSPEWQAIRFALERSIPVRFMDLPQAHVLLPAPEPAMAAVAEANGTTETAPVKAIDADADDEESDEDEGDGKSSTSTPIPEKEIDPAEVERMLIRRDPLGYIARIAGFTDGERWWDRMVESRPTGTDMFGAVHELMTALREESGKEPDLEERRREAYMRQTLRAAQKEGFAKIAVVCGAWHTPALAKMPSVKEDSEILKGLPKTKVVATWIPWTYDRMSRKSGYGAGVNSPGWYEHLWETKSSVISSWMTKTARVFSRYGNRYFSRSRH